MVKLFGRTWTRRELEAHVGRLEQVGGVRRLRWAEGFETGTEQVQVRTGAGLTYYVAPSRGLDISLTEFGGVPLSWQAAAGDVHPAYYDPRGLGWLRSAVGGLLMTCGLTYVGAPGEDAGVELGLHGRAHHLPARHVTADGRWNGDTYEMKVSGRVEEAATFGEHMVLTRSVRSVLGENRIMIKDVVENAGFVPTPHMILYHFNFGFPLLGEATRVEFPSRVVQPRESETPTEGYDRWDPPQAVYQERVYYHQDLVEENGWAAATIRNPQFPMADGAGTVPLVVHLRWAAENLPRLVQWKMSGAGTHVLGIEPANCYVEGRAVERARGTLVTLEPGESRTYELTLEVAVESGG